MKKLLVVLVAGSLAIVAGCSDSRGWCSSDEFGYCTGDDVPQPTPIVISPTSATFTVGQSQAFTVQGGFPPYYTQVVGCLGEVAACTPSRISGSDLSFSKPFDTEWNGHALVVTFLDASLKPSRVALEVWGSSYIGLQSKRETLVSIPLQVR